MPSGQNYRGGPWLAERIDISKRAATAIIRTLDGAFRTRGDSGPWRAPQASIDNYILEQQTLAKQQREAYKVLLVEDNPVDVRLFREALDTTPIRVRLATREDAASALLLIQRNRPALLVLDLSLPGGMTAFELLEKIKHAKIKTAVLTSSERPEDIEQAERLGAFMVLQKGVDLERYMARVAGLIEGLARVEIRN